MDGASSKALLAYLTKQEARPMVARLAKAHKRTQAEIQAEFATIRANGYAVSHGERVLGVSAIAAPIVGADDQVHYCVSLAGPTVRVRSQQSKFVKLVLSAAADISSRYGGAVDSPQLRS
jgi:DNA-binding IclR family transcriptional regulator